MLLRSEIYLTSQIETKEFHATLNSIYKLQQILVLFLYRFFFVVFSIKNANNIFMLYEGWVKNSYFKP